jgi:hypothetical protein
MRFSPNAVVPQLETLRRRCATTLTKSGSLARRRDLRSHAAQAFETTVMNKVEPRVSFRTERSKRHVHICALAFALVLPACGGADSADTSPEDSGNHDATATSDATSLDSATFDVPANVPDAAHSLDAAWRDAAATDAAGDVSSGEGGPREVDAEPDASCDVDAGCYVIPPNWSLVAYSPIQTACPSGFAAAPPTTFFGYAEPSTACTCPACTVFGPPTCNWVGIQGSYGVADGGPATCVTTDPAGDLSNDPPGGCHTDLPQGDYSGLDLAYVPAPPAGGACSCGAGVLTSPVTFPPLGETCSPDSPASAGCSGDTCTVRLPPPFRACVTGSLIRACPENSVFTQAEEGTAGPSASCSGCDGDIDASCSGTVQLFSDSHCLGNEFDVPADGQCHSPPPGIGTIGSYRYAANAATNISCSPIGPPIVETSWQELVTVCCVP